MKEFILFLIIYISGGLVYVLLSFLYEKWKSKKIYGHSRSNKDCIIMWDCLWLSWIGALCVWLMWVEDIDYYKRLGK